MRTMLFLEPTSFDGIDFPCNGVYASASAISFVFQNQAITFQDNKKDIIGPLLANFRLALEIIEDDPGYYYFHDTLSSSSPLLLSFTYEAGESSFTLHNADTTMNIILVQTDLIKIIMFLEKL